VVVTQAELRGQSFRGQVARTAASIDTGTRTMQVEIALPNPDGTLLPGAYVQVALPLASSGSLTMPTNTLMFRGEGTLVAVVDVQGKVALRKVGVGRNLGENFEVLDGVSESDRVVLNPPDWLAEGQGVALVPANGAAGAASSRPGKDTAGKDRL
jgi:multidrug efflux pump subunit AcrA (membrane-fusion protein)